MEDLIEAYLSVYEESDIDEGYEELPVDKMMARIKSITRRQRKPDEPRWTKDDQRASDIRKVAGTHSRAKVRKIEQANRARGNQQEQVDLYDLVLDHLLDEGYADTEENAITIMANMSEEWIDEIINEAQIMSVSGPGGLKHMINPNVLKLQNAAAKERQQRQEKENRKKETNNAERLENATKKSIQRLNAKPGEDDGSYDNAYYGDDDTSDGKRHYSLSRTNRSARRRRASGR